MTIFGRNDKAENLPENVEGEELWNEIISDEQILPDKLLIKNREEDQKSLWKKIEDYGTKSGKKVPNQILKTNYESRYDEKSLFEKIRKFALVAGKKVIIQVLVLYYCLLDRDTPNWAKTTIIGALGYYIFPLDAIPDIIPGLGYSDDLGVLIFAMSTVIVHIKREHKERASEQVTTIFGND